MGADRATAVDCVGSPPLVIRRKRYIRYIRYTS